MAFPPPAPPINKETAADYARQAVKSRVARLRAQREELEAARVCLLELEKQDYDRLLDKRVAACRNQIDVIDKDINNPKIKPETKAKLIGAKTRLWELAYGKPRTKPPLNPPGPREAPPEPVIERILAKADTPTGSGFTENGES